MPENQSTIFNVGYNVTTLQLTKQFYEDAQHRSYNVEDYKIVTDDKSQPIFTPEELVDDFFPYYYIKYEDHPDICENCRYSRASAFSIYQGATV